ncbi:hypothetical protein BJ973_002978 [Actinoplanes tereljensis]|uniref:TIR domain-containing protein n=1 Tax=Paractinoplanes tereljensis TaxID=571912 RepID=A0A919TW86_9ACTN|nr:TIR domain-containing protein [Actinoplanes tereljensis]GIF22657.1 hypothetical protein Ate02nite_53870 [Actinoplanes tereljensis]
MTATQRDLHPAITWRSQLPPPSSSTAEPLTCSWSCDGRRLLVISDSAEVWMFHDGRWRREWRSETLYRNPVGTAVWSPYDATTFACVRQEGVEVYRTTSSLTMMVWRQPMSRRLHAGGLTFSSRGARLAIADGSRTVHVTQLTGGGVAADLVLKDTADEVYWSPAGDQIVVQGPTGTHILPDPNAVPVKLADFTRPLTGMTWSWNGRMLCAADAHSPMLRVWDAEGNSIAELEGLVNAVVAFSADDRLLCAAYQRELRCWRTDTWQMVVQAGLADAGNQGWGVASSPAGPMLALWRRGIRRRINTYEVDVDTLLDGPAHPSRTYRNAKVVLVGETGVGKSGLGLVLSGQAYRPTDSTHARQVLTFEDTEVALPDGGVERRETLLWDMAGQSGYRLIHQLHLAEATAALIVFDGRSETDPFAGVRYWARALRQQSGAAALLVAARGDRGGVPAGDKRIAALRDELGLVGYFETSAREGRQIPELAAAIRATIDWGALPLSVSTELFETIKQFLVGERDGERVLATAGDLFRDFRRHHPALPDDGSLRPSFDACVRLLELRDLLRRLSFGDFVLLRPEMLDFYASALIDEARAQPDGLGCLSEPRALAGDFPMPSDGRLPAAEERLLLIAVVEELLRHDLGLREFSDSGVDLVFPSQLTADRPIDADPEAADVVFRFDGAVHAVYATLVVRLSRVSAYSQSEMWRNGSTYRAKVGGVCGLRVVQAEEGRGELTVFFDAASSEETRYLFEDYVHAHLRARAIDGSVRRERLFVCPKCAYRVDPAVVRRRLERGAIDVLCADCEEARILLLDREERLTHAAAVRDMNASADAGREAAVNTARIRGKEATQDYDVFLSYNTADHGAVAEIAGRLRDAGVLAWFAPVDLVPGARWRGELERQIGRVRAGAIFLGPHGLGMWQKMEEELLVNESARRDLRIIPVQLPGYAGQVTGFLSQWHAADFRHGDPDPFARLLEGITQ